MIFAGKLKKKINFSNFFSSIAFTKSLKKNIPIEYKIKAPQEIEVTDMRVPIHLPNKTPEIIKIGDPKPRSATQTTEKIKK